MEQDYTSNVLIKYLYRETSLTETLEIENAISEDSKVRAEYQRLKNGCARFPKVTFYPTDETISNILTHSRLSAAMSC